VFFGTHLHIVDDYIRIAIILLSNFECVVVFSVRT